MIFAALNNDIILMEQTDFSTSEYEFIDDTNVKLTLQYKREKIDIKVQAEISFNKENIDAIAKDDYDSTLFAVQSYQIKNFDNVEL